MTIAADLATIRKLASIGKHAAEWDAGGRVDSTELDLILNVIGHVVAKAIPAIDRIESALSPAPDAMAGEVRDMGEPTKAERLLHDIMAVYEDAGCPVTPDGSDLPKRARKHVALAFKQPASLPADVRALVEEARRLDAEATQGPWTTFVGAGIQAYCDPLTEEAAHVMLGDSPISVASTGPASDPSSARDAAFIARARTLLPALARAVEAKVASAKPVAYRHENGNVALTTEGDRRSVSVLVPGGCIEMPIEDARGLATAILAVVQPVASAGAVPDPHRWDTAAIGTAGTSLADALAPAVGAWLSERAGEHDPEDLAGIASEVVRAVADERGLYRARNERKGRCP